MKKILFAAFMFGALSASAETLLFSGSGSSGTLPTGEAWAIIADPTLRDVPTWGVPGLGQGNASYGGPDALIEFSVTFTNLPVGITIDETPDPTPLGYDDYTRFQGLNGVYWNIAYTGTNTVTFFAPGNGSGIQAGQQFFVNVAFAGGALTTVAFTGTETTIPEPSTFALLGAGLGVAGLIGRKLR